MRSWCRSMCFLVNENGLNKLIMANDNIKAPALRVTVSAFRWARRKVVMRRLVARSRRQENAIFIWIPKTAGSSVYEILRGHHFVLTDKPWCIQSTWKGAGRVTFGHMSIESLVAANLLRQSYLDSAFILTFCRNPYDRMVSLYHHFRSRLLISRHLEFKDFVARVCLGSVPPVGFYNFCGLSQANPQIDWFVGLGRSPDFIGRYENLAQDLSELTSLLHGYQSKPNRVDVPSENRSNRSPTSSYFTPDLQRSVFERYRADFEFFGYDKDDLG